MPQLHATSTALLKAGPGDDKLQSLSFSLQFLGHVPIALRERIIPIEITISLPDSLACSVYPILSVAPGSRRITDGVAKLTDGERDELRRSLSSTPIIFLPITADFDHRNLQDWASLSKRIGDWLLRVVAERRSIIWRWGREAFWITFVAAYPSFPRGDWPRWPCEIALDGPFICHWVERQQTSAHVEDGGEDVADAMHDSPAVDTNIPLLRDVHAELWARLQNHLSVLRDV